MSDKDKSAGTPVSDDTVLDQKLVEELACALKPVEPEAERREALRSRILEAVRFVEQSGEGQEQEEEEESSAEQVGSSAFEDLTEYGPNVISFLAARDRKWSAYIPGVEKCVLYESKTRRTVLLRMAAGSCLPSHRHHLDEESFLVEGSAEIEGRQLRVGDYQFMPAGTLHPLITTREGCIVMVHGEKQPMPRLTSSLVKHVFSRFFKSRD